MLSYQAQLRLTAYLSSVMDAPIRHKTPRWAAERMLHSITSMPSEIVNYILENVYPPASPTAMMYKAFPKKRTMDRMPYLTPPANGRCPFIDDLPIELRKAIFTDLLPSKDDFIHPKCDEDKDGLSIDRSKFLRSNRTVDLMTLNKKIRDEIALMIYEERTFVSHVHEGLKHGGIELLHAGRQPLHYQDSISDGRFWKFSRSDSDKSFGFRRLKKIRIQIFPSQDESCKHSAINTYFTTLALVRLLERNCEDDKDRITNLTIEFMKRKATGTEQGRAAIQRAEHYWWDPDKIKPRETSIHGLPNIELVLRPFANLTGCHEVNIEMPDHVHDSARIAVFVRDLKASMKSPYGTIFADDDLERKIESARWAMEEYVYSMKYGIKHRKVEYLNEMEAQEAAQQPMDLDSDAEDDGTERSKKKRVLSPGKREWSPGSTASSPGSDSKRSKANEEPSQDYSSFEEDEAMARAMEESARFAGLPTDEDEEEKQIQKAIEASMVDLARRNIPDRTARESANGYGEGASTSTRNRSAVVGQGRTLGGVQHYIDDARTLVADRYQHNSTTRPRISRFPADGRYSWLNPHSRPTHRSRLVLTNAAMGSGAVNDSTAVDLIRANPFGQPVPPAPPNSAEDNTTQSAAENANSAAPWNAASPSLKNFYKNKLIDGSSNTATSNESGQPSSSAPGDEGISPFPRDIDVSLPNAPPIDNLTSNNNQAEVVNVEDDADGEDEPPFRRRRFPRS